MSFQFSLMSVLRLHQATEEMEELRLRELNAAVEMARRHVAEMTSRQTACRKATQELLLRGVVKAELEALTSSDDAWEVQRVAGVQRLHELEKRRNEQEKAWLKARQDRQVLTELRANRKTEYDQEESRQEQRGADEVFLMRNASNLKH